LATTFSPQAPAPGRHSAALDEQHWNDIAAFIIDGTRPAPRVSVRNRWVEAAGDLTPVIWVGLVTIAAVPFYLCLTALGLPEMTGFRWVQTWNQGITTHAPAWVWAGALIIWMRTLGLVLTRL
jgi:hypothetical protein